MRTVFIFKNNHRQAIRIPRDLEFKGVSKLEITRVGNTLTLRPVRPSWKSLCDLPAADLGLLAQRPDIIGVSRF